MSESVNQPETINDSELPLTLFRKSLRQWQAQWKASQPADAAEPRKATPRKIRLIRGRQPVSPS